MRDVLRPAARRCSTPLRGILLLGGRRQQSVHTKHQVGLESLGIDGTVVSLVLVAGFTRGHAPLRLLLLMMSTREHPDGDVAGEGVVATMGEETALIQHPLVMMLLLLSGLVNTKERKNAEGLLSSFERRYRYIIYRYNNY